MIDKLILKLKSLLKQKKYLEFSGYGLLIFLTLSCSIIVTFIVCSHIFSFLASRFEAVIAIVGAYVLIFLWYRDKERKKQAQIQSALMEKTSAQQSAEKALAESNYSVIRQCLFSTLSEYADIVGLVKPVRLSEIDSPCRVILKGNTYMTQYVVPKKSESVSAEKIKEMLQIRIAQKLTALEFAGITQTNHIYNGRAYPILCIDEVRDNGSYVQIDMAWASDSYCNLLDSRAQAKIENLKPPSMSYHDKDF